MGGVGRDGGSRWWWRGDGKAVGVLGAVSGQVAETLDFIGRQTPSAGGRVKVGFRGRVFLTGCKTWAGGWRPGFGGDECGALGRGVITGERKGVSDFPAL